MGRSLPGGCSYYPQFRMFWHGCQSRFLQSSPSPLDKPEQCCGVCLLTLAQEDRRPVNSLRPFAGSAGGPAVQVDGAPVGGQMGSGNCGNCGNYGDLVE